MAFPLLGSPKQTFLDSSGNPLASGTLAVLDPADDTNKASYPTADDADAATNANVNPIVLDSRGEPPTGLFGIDNETYKLTLKDSAGATIWTQDDVRLPAGSAAKVGALLYPTTGAETSATITPTNFENATDVYDVRRVGIVPDSTAARTANTTALKALLDPSVTGPVGNFIFPNISGTTTYYFDGFIEVRDGCRLDLCGCTIDFTRTYVAADDTLGFFMAIRDVTIQNGSINVAYDGSAGTVAGPVFRLGSRTGYAFGTHTNGVEDEDLSSSMGNMTLRNLRITSNNPGSFAVTMLGGTDNVLFENIVIEGQAALIYGIYYEWGYQHFDATVASIVTSHAHNLQFRNITINNMDKTDGAGIALIGANSASVDGLYCNGGYVGLGTRPGEALYYNVAADDAAGATQAVMVFRNIVCNDMVNAGINLDGSDAATGYLSTEGLTETDQVDRIRFTLDGFNVESDGFGVIVDGPSVVRNGKITGTNASGGLVITDNCVQFDIDNVTILGGGNSGIRASLTGIWATPRHKNGQIRNCVVAGTTANGMHFAETNAVLIENCRIGYNTLYDNVNESSLTTGINADATANGIVCKNNFITTNSGTAYVLAGTSNRGCQVWSPDGEITTSGGWALDGLQRVAASVIIDRLDALNTDDKYTGKKVWDTTNKRMLVSSGSVNTSDWEMVDGTVQITPV